MNFFFATILLFIGLSLPLFAGLPFVRILDIEMNRVERTVLAALFGWLFFGTVFTVAGFAGFGFSVTGGISIIFLLWLIFFCLFRRIPQVKSDCRRGKEKDEEGGETGEARIGRYLLIVSGIILFAVIFIESIGDTESMPMQAVWGYKAKVFYLEGRIPLSFFSDPDIPFTHQSYPLLFPVMLTWSYLFMGGVYEPMLKIIPPLAGVLIYLSLYAICRREGVGKVKSLMIATLFCGGAAFNLCSTIIYAENIMLLYILWGAYLLFIYIRGDGELQSDSCCNYGELLFSDSNSLRLFLPLGGFILLAGGACVKNEGVIYFASAVIFVVMLLLFQTVKNLRYSHKADFKGFGTVVFAIAVSCCFVVPWVLFRYYLNLEVRDFAVMDKLQAILNEGFIHSGSYGVLKKSVIKFADAMFVDLTVSCGVWYFLLFNIVKLQKRLLRRENLFFLWIILLPIAIFAVSFIFSIRPLDWHMDAVPRLLLPPMLIAWLSVAGTRKQYGGEHCTSNSPLVSV